MKTIYDFKKGDEIVRVEAAKPYSPISVGFFGEQTEGVRDRSYMGKKMIFVGIANGKIYCKGTDSFSLAMFGDKLLSISLDKWDEGWDFWFDPEKLLEGLEPEESLNDKIEKAVLNEDYELAAKLRDKLENSENANLS